MPNLTKAEIDDLLAAEMAFAPALRSPAELDRLLDLRLLAGTESKEAS